MPHFQVLRLLQYKKLTALLLVGGAVLDPLSLSTQLSALFGSMQCQVKPSSTDCSDSCLSFTIFYLILFKILA